ncbi:mucin-5AC-like [Hyalella azteca]|uniref:Mucin-5AC-like n=1 Tax=Hyalella azteca TaxID=294128 RepID=A0A8B7NSM0_HYAAZ|nr:mucin-5AC-like [Hyalella azteca]
MSGKMINSSNTVTVRPEISDEVTSNELVKLEATHHATDESQENENVLPKSESVESERRGVKRPIDVDDYVDDDDECSFDSEQFKDDLDEDSSEDKVWETFQGLGKQRGGRLSRTYGLRPRTGIRRAWVDGETPPVRGASRRGRGRSNALKSKYRRNTANARERDRMKEINVAFANLRGALPSFTCRRITSMTKIKTLKLAASYIRALSDLLSDSPSEESKTLALQLFQDIPEQNNFVNSIRHTLDANVACGSQSSSASSINNHTVHTSTMSTNTVNRPSSALEAALTSTAKRPAYAMGQGQRYYSQGHHLASRPNFVPPPPLQLPSMNSTLNLHPSPTQHSPCASAYPVSPVVSINSLDCSLQHNYSNPSPTIITANVNVIQLCQETSTSERITMLTPNTSPASSQTFIPQSPYSPSPSVHSTTCLQPTYSEFPTNSTTPLPDSSISRTFYKSKTPMASMSPDISSNSQTPSPSFSFKEHIMYKSKISGSQIYSHSSAHVQPNHQSSVFFENSSPIPNSAPPNLQTTLHQPCETQPTGSTHNFLRNLPPKNALSPMPQAVEPNLSKYSGLKETQFQSSTTTKAGNSPKPETSFVPGAHSFQGSKINASSQSFSHTPRACLDSSASGLQETPDTSCPSWNNVNVEFNSLLDEPECVPEEPSLNWDELCWSLG